MELFIFPSASALKGDRSKMEMFPALPSLAVATLDVQRGEYEMSGGEGGEGKNGPGVQSYSYPMVQR